MIVVIQCAGSKRDNAGTFQTTDGRHVKFVAQPDLAPNDRYFYTQPDNISENGESWRDVLLRYNQESTANSLGLTKAIELYKPKIYSDLAERINPDKLYILSAGWGLIRADFLIPDYDITFSAQARNADAYKRRREADFFKDFRMLPLATDVPVLFFGSKNYLQLFGDLTSGIAAPRIVFCRSDVDVNKSDCIPVKYESPRRTNWHYECAEKFLAGDLKIPLEGVLDRALLSSER